MKSHVPCNQTDIHTRSSIWVQGYQFRSGNITFAMSMSNLVLGNMPALYSTSVLVRAYWQGMSTAQELEPLGKRRSAWQVFCGHARNMLNHRNLIAFNTSNSWSRIFHLLAPYVVVTHHILPVLQKQHRKSHTGPQGTLFWETVLHTLRLIVIGRKRSNLAIGWFIV